MGNSMATVAQVALSAALLGVGAALMVASFGGASIVAAGLISAGINGATTAITSAVEGKKPASWGDWGVATAIGAVTGVAGGCIGAAAGGLAKLTERAAWAARTVLAAKGVCIVAGSTVSSVTCNTITNWCHGRKTFDGVGVALATGAVGGLFACAGAATAHSMKRSDSNFWKHAFTRHAAGVGLDTAASTTSGVIGAAMNDQDIFHAGCIGFVSGVAAGAVTASVRGATKSHIRRQQQLERENRIAVPIREIDGVLFEFESGHRNEEHVDLHHTELKGRFDKPGQAGVMESSRFRDRATADAARELAVTAAAGQINQGVMPNIVTTRRNGLVAAIATVEKHERAVARATRVGGDVAKAQQKLDNAIARVKNARELFAGTVAGQIEQVNVDVPLKSCGYGYQRDQRIRQFGIDRATGHFKAVGHPNGSIVWHEVTVYPNYQPPTGRLGRLMQNVYAGDRQYRRQVVQAGLVRRNATHQRYHEEEEGHTLDAN